MCICGTRGLRFVEGEGVLCVLPGGSTEASQAWRPRRCSSPGASTAASWPGPARRTWGTSPSLSGTASTKPTHYAGLLPSTKNMIAHFQKVTVVVFEYGLFYRSHCTAKFNDLGWNEGQSLHSSMYQIVTSTSYFLRQTNVCNIRSGIIQFKSSTKFPENIF